MTTKLASYLGLAQRAGGIIYGEDRICENLSGIEVVLIDAAAPDKYKERLRKRLTCECFEIDCLPHALHRENVKAAAVINKGLAEAIINLLR